MLLGFLVSYQTYLLVVCVVRVCVTRLLGTKLTFMLLAIVSMFTHLAYASSRLPPSHLLVTSLTIMAWCAKDGTMEVG